MSLDSTRLSFGMPTGSGLALQVAWLFHVAAVNQQMLSSADHSDRMIASLRAEMDHINTAIKNLELIVARDARSRHRFYAPRGI